MRTVFVADSAHSTFGVVTEQGSSAPQVTAKVLDVARLLGCAGQASDAVLTPQ